MNRVISYPPDSGTAADGTVVGGWWHEDPDGRIVCDLCPRECRLKPGDRGFCFVRENQDGQMRLTTYGRSTGFCIDPIEKKPLNHFYPGTSVLSFGTAGCNLGCKFCQNWSISKSREIRRLSDAASPAMIAQAARNLGCRSVAFTYNDPVIWAEYAIDTAKQCRSLDIKTVAVTAGYITPLARPEFFRWMDAANVDLKAFTETFYQHLTLSHLEPVLDTLKWLRHESNVWFEITNLVIPTENDGDDEFRRMCDWIVEHLGTDVPVHFTAFHPDFRLNDHPPTPVETLLRAYDIARQAGIHFVYVGNVDDRKHQSTYCPSCGELLIERNWYELGRYDIEDHRCGHCGERIAGRFDPRPGSWGRRRQPVQIARFAHTATETTAATKTPPAADRPPRPSLGMSSEPPIVVPLTASPEAGAAQPPTLNPEHQAAALRAASELVYAAVSRQPVRWSDESLAGAAKLAVLGCFVSLKRNGRLRGCCGFLGRRGELRQALQESATTSAIGDTRMPPVARDELQYLELELWLLHNLRRVDVRGEDRAAAIEIGRHGLQIQLGSSRGLLLPGVAVEHGFDAPAFLRQVCIKAGLAPTAWKDDQAQLNTFEGCVVRGPFDRSVLLQAPPVASRFTRDEIERLAAFCRKNVVATARGAVPDYYLTEVSDGGVHGICLTVTVDGMPERHHFSRTALRNPVPLQATLFQMCETAGKRLAEAGRTVRVDDISVELAVLDEPAMQGTVAEPDLNGLEPTRRAIFIVQGNRSAWRYDPDQTAEQLLASAAGAAEISLPDQAAAYSFVTIATHRPMHLAQVPRPSRGPAVRPPAVAGSFYPSQPAQLNRLLDELTPQDPVVPERWHAALVPHAGLIYSGRIAVDVLRRVMMPRSIIILGPKHTNLGVDWAVAPHETWSLPGITLASDVELAERLCRSIPRLQMDAAAHQREHAIEVELPWIARYAPDSSVVGIAISHADLRLCQEFAAGLAQAIAEQADETLLVISTDMNHFANDVETRRVDAMAMEAMERMDSEQLYHTVRDHHISMCGMLPACIVLETLRRMDRLHEAKTVGYATSGDVSGDRSRVVGYAGMLFR